MTWKAKEYYQGWERKLHGFKLHINRTQAWVEHRLTTHLRLYVDDIPLFVRCDDTKDGIKKAKETLEQVATTMFEKKGT